MLNNLFEKRAINFQTLWGAGDDLVDLNQSGTIVNSETTFKITAVYSAVSLISDTIATLPLDAYIRRDGTRGPFRPRPAWVTKPDLDQQPYLLAVDYRFFTYRRKRFCTCLPIWRSGCKPSSTQPAQGTDQTQRYRSRNVRGTR